MKLGELATRLGCKLEGSPDLTITGVTGMEEAGESDLTFLANPKYIRKLHTTRAAAVIVGPDVQSADRPVLRSDNPYLSFAKALEIFFPPPRSPLGIHPTAVIAAGVKIGLRPSIGPYVTIEENVEIGDDCVLKSFVAIYSGVRIGDRFTAHSHSAVREKVRIGNDVVLQNGVVVGADGFGFARQADGSYYKIVQSGPAVIEDNVEIQANSCIDRATVGETRIRRGTKIDNLVQVGHSCDIGEDSLLCGQAGLAGSCKVGRNVILAGQVGVAGHLTIGDNVIATAQSGIPHDVVSNTTISGSPAIEHSLWLKWSALYGKLPQIYAAVREIRNRLKIQ